MSASGRILTSLLGATGALLLSSCANLETQSASAAQACAAAQPATEVLETLIDRFNARDVAGWDATFHYPHVLLAGGRTRMFDDPSQQANTIDNLLEQGWRRSAWEDLRVLQCSDDKAHMAATFLRYGEGDTLISRTPALFTVERRNEKWGVTARSML